MDKTFTIDDVREAFERLLTHAEQQAVAAACIWAIHAAQEDVLAILAGEWRTDEPAAPSAPAGDTGDDFLPF